MTNLNKFRLFILIGLAIFSIQMWGVSAQNNSASSIWSVLGNLQDFTVPPPPPSPSLNCGFSCDPINGVDPQRTLISCGYETIWQEMIEKAMPNMVSDGSVLEMIKIDKVTIFFSAKKYYIINQEGNLKFRSIIIPFNQNDLDYLGREYSKYTGNVPKPDQKILVTILFDNGSFTGKTSNYNLCFTKPPIEIFESYFARPNQNQQIDYNHEGSGKTGTGQDDRWRFTANSGDELRIEVNGQTNSSFQVELLSKAGELLSVQNSDSDSSAAIDFSVPISDSYQVAVRANSARESSTYRIFLRNLAPPTSTPPPISTSTPIPTPTPTIIPTISPTNAKEIDKRTLHTGENTLVYSISGINNGGFFTLTVQGPEGVVWQKTFTADESGSAKVNVQQGGQFEIVAQWVKFDGPYTFHVDPG